MDKRSREFVVSSFRYVIAAAEVYIVLRNPVLFEFQIDLLNTTKLDLHILLWPLLALILGAYLGRTSRFVLTGNWVTPIASTLRYAGISGSLYLLFSSPQAPHGLRFTSNIFLAGTGAMTALYLVQNTVGLSHPLLKFTAKALRYLAFGVTIGLMIEGIPEIPIPGLDSGFIILGILTSAITFLEYLKDSPLGYISTLGELASRRRSVSLFFATILSFYASTYREILVREMQQSAGFISLFEWVMVGLIALLFFRNLYGSLGTSVSDLKGDWISHIQEIETRSDTDLDRWTRLVDDFTEKGEKDLLILYLFELLRRNKIPLEQIQVELSQLMDWSEKAQNLGLVFNETQRNRRLRDRREAVLDHVIERVQVRIGG